MTIKNFGGKAIRIAEYILLTASILCILSVVITGIKTGKPTIFGYRPMFICSGSMEPTIKTFSVIVGKPVNAEDIHVGDICTYERNGLMICHRIIDITDDGFIFKGDNNGSADTPAVSPDSIKYRVVWY